MDKKATFAELKTEIAKLQKQADEIRQSERVEVINRIKEAVSIYEITAKDLGIAKQLRKPKRPKDGKLTGAEGGARPARKPRPSKFTDGKGNDWNGRGEQPDWVKAAIATGRTLNDLKRKPFKPSEPAAQKK